MKLVNIFAAVGIVSLVAAGCTATSSGGGTGGTGTGGTSTGGTGTGGTSTGGTSTGGTSTGGTSTGGTSTGGTGTGGTSTGGSGTGGASGDCTSTLVGSTCKQLTTGVAACDTCMQGNCCNEMDTCFGDAACAGLNNCIQKNCQGITDQTAFTTCVTSKCASCATTSAQTEYNALGKCENTSCGTQCGGGTTDGGI